MPAIPISWRWDSSAVICGEWQSDRNSANPQERAHAAANEETHNSSAAKVAANMRPIFTAQCRVAQCLNVNGASSILRQSHIPPQPRWPMGDCIPRLLAVCCRAAGELKTKTLMKYAAVRVQNILAL